MSVINQVKNQHLLWRAGFGPSVSDLPQTYNASPEAYYKALAKASAKDPVFIKVADSVMDGLVKGIQQAGKLENLSRDDKKDLRRKSREEIRNLNLEWIDEMVNSDQQLREKMSLFWHGHFACRNLNIVFQQELLQIIRKNALGNFGDLLKEVSKSAAMLAFLNNQQNKKEHPNENFAREVMELFTMGRGNYKEEDIKEAARAFTGWGFNLKAEFVFRKFQHDNGVKNILGRSGNFDGDDVLNILLEQKQTARYLTQKIYKYFVNENVVDEKVITVLADKFYQSNYDINDLLKNIFTSKWFYDNKNIGSKIKSPVELLVGIRRILPVTFENPEAQLLLQRVLGQILFYPPNVAGWPGGKNWIDSSTLMFRLRIPQLLANADEFSVKPKDMPDDMLENYQMKQEDKLKVMGKKMQGQIVNATIDWSGVIKQFSGVSRGNLLGEIALTLLQSASSSINKNVLEKYIDNSSKENYIKSAVVQLMCTPDYQLC
ncbi:MAG: DUF1800 domain-containing protein [Sphingobacteriales bacterium]|nr:DUF1800 domain-containing protein [Sphingobacteriales bacterium]